MLTPIQKALGRLAAHQGFRRYFFDTSWMFGEQVLRILAGLFVGIYVAHYLGSEQFWVCSYAIAFVALFGSIAKLGLDGIVVGFIQRAAAVEIDANGGGEICKVEEVGDC